MLRIPFFRPSIGPEEIDEVVATLKSGWLTTGPKTKQFEREFAEYLRKKHAVAVNSCTAALHLALEAIGLKAGQGVIVPTMTFAATAEVVRYLGGRPILVDCHEHDFNLDVADAERKIQSALADEQPVVAIMPVHYGGQVGDALGVQALAKRFDLKIIEDAAHCCPAYYRSSSLPQEERAGERRPDQPPAPGPQGSAFHVPPASPHRLGRGEGQGEVVQFSTLNSQLSTASDWLPVGSSADISCFSFYANKCITTGEGGMACTDNDEFADRMRIMSLHGISRDAWKRYTGEGSWYYEIIAPGYKYNFTDIASAIGIHQLRKADLFHQRRSAIAAQYRDLLAGVEEVTLLTSNPDRIHSWHLFVIRLRLEKLQIDRAQVISELQKAGIGTSVHWLPLHMHPYYRQTFGYEPHDLPVAARLYPEIVTLPLYPDMSEADVKYVCDTLKQIIVQHLRPTGAALSPVR